MKLQENRLILIELNEVNFDIATQYIRADPERFPGLTKLLTHGSVRTTSEKNYDELEPWIQWPSVHTMKNFAEHGIFRLGDIVGSKVPQIFEQLEEAGYHVGAISAMNAENRLKHPAYFIPDPWTKTPSDPSWWSRSLTEAVSQSVNDNSQSKITLRSILQISLSMVRFARPRHYRKYLMLIAGSRRRPWLKSLMLDLLLHDVHWHLFGSKKPDFSVLFLNAGAHIQHHYFFNAAPLNNAINNSNPAWYISPSADPVADMLEIYDFIVDEYFSRADATILLATGLTQKPYDRIQYYYRLNSHDQFLRGLGIAFDRVIPRMTRDFLIEFADADGAQNAHKILSSIQVDGTGKLLFDEIDDRGASLFVTLTYPDEILPSTSLVVSGVRQPLLPLVSFVAIKNGMHHEEGYAYFTSEFAQSAPLTGAHVSKIGNAIMKFFKLPIEA